MVPTAIHAKSEGFFQSVLIPVIFAIQFLLPVSTAAQLNTEFDGLYSGTLTLTITTTIPADPPIVMSNTQSSSFSLTVRDGKILDAGEGGIIDSAGNGKVSYNVPIYGTIVFNVHFTKGAPGKNTSVTGEIDWTANFGGLPAVLTGSYAGSGGDKFFFSISPNLLHNAKIGSPYIPIVSLCQPITKKGGLCGVFPTSTQRNPKGGKAPYTFKLKMGSPFLPTGMILNPFTGQISGTPIKGQKIGTRELIVCVTDANDRFTGVCRSVTLVLTK